MSNKPKVHYPRLRAWGNNNAMCGTSYWFISTKPEEVTCKTCIKFGERLPEWHKK